VVAGEEVVVVCYVKGVVIEDGDGVGAVDLRVSDGLDVLGDVVFKQEVEDFEAGAGLRVVDNVEGSERAVVGSS
jgi:Flp pilus assembly CpaE family ATPase